MVIFKAHASISSYYEPQKGSGGFDIAHFSIVKMSTRLARSEKPERLLAEEVESEPKLEVRKSENPLLLLPPSQFVLDDSLIFRCINDIDGLDLEVLRLFCYLLHPKNN